LGPDEILDRVCRAVDALVKAGEPWGGLFPSLLDLKTHEMLAEMPDAIPGQRDGDRSHLGCNLIHDEAALKTMFAVAEATGQPEYAQAADRYLRRFAEHCTDTETGVFPWGEHAYWHLADDRVGNSYLLRDPGRASRATHDHLRQAPVWLWEKLYGLNPRCVERFAEGLDYHWTAGEPPEYIRHAYIEVCEHYARGARSCDFPRHAGFYILDWAYAYARTQREDFADQIARMLDYWWTRRDPDGLLLIESRSPESDARFHQVNAPAQTLSLGVSLLESSELLEPSRADLAGLMRARADVYVSGFLAAPHDVRQGTFVILSRRGTGEIVQTMPIWGSVYGVWPASYVALTVLCGLRRLPIDRLRAWSEAVGNAYLETSFPSDIAVPAMDSGLALGLLADLYDVTGDAQWLDGGMALAQRLLDIYMDHDLPRGAAGIDWYESQMGPTFLLHGLARVALMARDGRPCVLEADYTAR